MQSPEEHTLRLSAPGGYQATNLRVGHSYGMVSDQALWTFADWITDRGDDIFRLGPSPTEIKVDWRGRLPYPPGEDIRGRIREIQQGLLREP